MKKLTSTRILKSVAEKLGYQTTILSVGNPERLMISHKGKICVVNNSLFGSYPEVQRWQQQLFDNKAQTQEVLTKLGYATIPTLVIDPKLFKSFSELNKFTENKIEKYPIIIKPTRGYDGKNVKLAHNKKELSKILRHSYKTKKLHLIQPVLEHDEYRILIINNKVELAHTKQLNCVYGDGKSTIAELLKQKKDHEKYPIYIKKELIRKNLNSKSILEKDVTFSCHITGSSSPGAYFETKKIPKKTVDWAKKLAKKISSPTIGIDVFAPKGIGDPASFLIIELNANPGVDYILKRYNDEKTMTAIMERTLKHYFDKK